MRHRICGRIAMSCLLAMILSSGSHAQQMSSFDRGRALDMLQTISSAVKKHYYDPKFHGVDFDAKVAEARQEIQKATSFNIFDVAHCRGAGHAE